MSGRGLKQFIGTVVRKLPLRFLPIDSALTVSQRISAGLAALLFQRDWRLEARGRPQFFKHQINLSRWLWEPSRWSFTARGVYAREHMFRGCKVLDLCCGDGTYSYLFFSDIAGHIDAVDLDRYAIEYAKKHYQAPSIAYRNIDIIKEPLPSCDYDVVVWNAAICYFSEQDIRGILVKIVQAGRSSLVLDGMLPKANGWVDHKTEFADTRSVERLLRDYFGVVMVKEVDEGPTITFYFHASAPLRAA